MIKSPVIKIDDFSGGFITSNELVASTKHSPDCQNVYVNSFGKLVKRNGYDKLNSASESASGNSIYHYVETETTQYLMALWGTTLKKMDVVTGAWDGTWDTISVNANGTTITGTVMHNTTFNGDLIITTESRDVPQKYDPDDNSGQYTNLHYGGTGTAPSGKYCINWYDHVWIANTSANPDRVYYSSAADHTTWSALDYQDLITPGDVGITGLARLRGRLYVFKANSIHRITYLGGTPLLNVTEVKSATGTKSPRSIVNINLPDEGEALIFLGSDSQLYLFDGYNCLPIGQPIYKYNGISNYCLKGDGATYGLSAAYFASVHAVNYQDLSQYIVYYCLDNDTTAKYSINYDYSTKAFFPQAYAVAFNDSVIADNGSGLKKIYTVGTNYAYLMDSGADDDSTAINAYWLSMRMDGGGEIYLKKYRYITITTKSVATTPIIYYRVDWDSSWTTLATMTTSINKHVYDLPIFENLLQLKIEDNSSSASFEFQRITISQKPIGEGE